MLTHSLSGSWEFHQAGQPETHWLPATVPGCVHTDLLANNQIPDPYYRDNENQVMWVGQSDWLYRRSFTVKTALLHHRHILLRCEGLDTLATIWLNGHEIGRTDNQFRTWEFDVKSLLRRGQNEIEIRFDSALNYGQARLEEKYIHSWSTDTHKLPGGNYVRKSQCNFGWDWGPRLVTCGIWREIELVAFDYGRLTDLHIQQDHSQPGQVTLSCTAAIERHTGEPLLARCCLSLGEEIVGIHAVQFDGPTAETTIHLENPQLWWPNGLGAQPLYTVTLTLLDSEEQPLDQWQRQIGLRTLHLIRSKDQWGESFHFACNDVPFFAKGANWIPADTFITSLGRDQYADLLQSAAGSHMNMLRVWGGGIYEQDDFYDLCDQLGICVWQDFMFACATYPTYEEAFLENTRLEAIENIKRLRHHASLALWCGNNELEQGLVDETWTDTAMSWEDYGRLFDDLLAQLTAEFDPQTDYWPGSPHTPYEDRYNFNDPRWGDAHIWDVWHGLKPFEFYYTCFHRFNSEFGFQSFPEPQVVRSFTEPQDRNISGPIMEYHQRSPNGNSLILHYMMDWFLLPTSFDMTLWLSQILQGMAIKHAVEHWRRTMPRGMGTLYWQLNDCWPVASWSSLDYYGRWKALHHMARHFFAPLMLSAVPDWDTGLVALHVTNDHLQPLSATIHWRVTTALGQPVTGGRTKAEIGPNQNNEITTLDLASQVEEYGRNDLLVWLQLETGGQIVSTNLALFCRPKHLGLADPEISWELSPGPDNRTQITLTARKPALWAWLEIDGERLDTSDNFFHLQPDRPQTVTLLTTQPDRPSRHHYSLPPQLPTNPRQPKTHDLSQLDQQKNYHNLDQLDQLDQLAPCHSPLSTPHSHQANPMKTTHLFQEIHQQPDVLANLLQRERPSLQSLTQAIKARDISHIVIAARGTSDNAARYAQYVLGANNGLQIALATPSLFTIYERPIQFKNALVLGISQSGKSPDIVAVLAEAQRQNQLTAVITNNPTSDLSRVGDFVIDLGAGDEKSVAATKTYTASLMAVALLSALLSQNAQHLSELETIPFSLRQTLALQETIAQIAPRYRYMSRSIIIGRGFNYATAFEMALKVKELTYTIAEPYSSADFLHGPLALIEQGFPVVVLAPGGKMLLQMRQLTDSLRDRQAEIIAFSDDKTILENSDISVPLTTVVPEWLSPITTIVPGQLFALNLAHLRHYNVDQPRAIKKVTETK